MSSSMTSRASVCIRILEAFPIADRTGFLGLNGKSLDFFDDLLALTACTPTLVPYLPVRTGLQASLVLLPKKSLEGL